MIRQLFFIEDNLIGETRRGLVRVHAEFQAPTSDLYFCSVCGEVFAKFPCIRSDSTTTPWQSYRSLCRKCAKHSTTLFTWPGSIWRSWDNDFIAALPMPVLLWELERHIDHIERLEHGNQT